MTCNYAQLVPPTFGSDNVITEHQPSYRQYSLGLLQNPEYAGLM
jgi:hypothetical protein